MNPTILGLQAMRPLLSLALCCTLPVAQERQSPTTPAKIGELVPEFTLPDPVGHRGRAKLSDWFGHPVLVFGWRTHLVDGMHAARPAWQLFEKHGKGGLVPIGCDRNQWRGKASGDESVFWLQITGRQPILYSATDQQAERDLPIEWSVARDDRSAVLIGVDGRLVANVRMEDIQDKRAPNRRKLEKLVAVEVKRRKSGWGDDPIAKKARALAFGRDKVAAALQQLAAVEEGADTAEQGAARTEIERHVQSRLLEIAWLRDDGQPIAAQHAIATLRKSVKGNAACERACTQTFASLTTADAKRDLALDKKLQKLLLPVLGTPRKGRAKPEVLGELRKFAAAHAESAVGRRAANLDRQVHGMLCGLLGMRWNDVEAKANG